MPVRPLLAILALLLASTLATAQDESMDHRRGPGLSLGRGGFTGQKVPVDPHARVDHSPSSHQAAVRLATTVPQNTTWNGRFTVLWRNTC